MEKKGREQKVPTQAKAVFKPEELEMIRDVARETGRSLTAYIRIVVLEAARRHGRAKR